MSGRRNLALWLTLALTACGEPRESAAGRVDPVPESVARPATARARADQVAVSVASLSDAYLRARAVEGIGSPDRSPETNRCADAIRALGETAITHLAADLRGADATAASRAADVLPLFGADATLPMLAILSDPSRPGEAACKRARHYALSVLSESSSAWKDGPFAARVARELMAQVRVARDRETRCKIIETLWWAGRAGAPYAEEWGRLAAAESSDPESLASSWLHLIRGLGTDARPAAETVVTMLRGWHDHDEWGIAALQDMEAVPQPALDLLRARLRSGDPAVVRSVCRVLEAWGSTGAAAHPEIRELLDLPAFAESAACALRLVPDPDPQLVVGVLRAANHGSETAAALIDEWARVPRLASRIESCLAGETVAIMERGVEALVRHGGSDGPALIERLLVGLDKAVAEAAMPVLTASATRAAAARADAAQLESACTHGEFAVLVQRTGAAREIDAVRIARGIEAGPPLAAAVRTAASAEGHSYEAQCCARGAALLSRVLPQEERSQLRVELARHWSPRVRRAVAAAIELDASPAMGSVAPTQSDLHIVISLLRDPYDRSRAVAPA